ncbi:MULTISPECIES: PAS domain S-box protein [Methylobacterium]|jgi:PAS domain S-box-containing protein|uniref:PAS domain S-box protein n=1 Tax=Methylobacterium TaxID=407 RepID=UPI000D5EFC95|nr:MULTISPECIES: PAS domain S-box protein [Methylobacterium]MBY0253223.1 PAS domain S-box protein [Methylobacterium organophilum]MDE3744230.1 PAS domain S-box protein [Methylobacterium radiotolerans]MWV22630.1 PAS domain S-box protein [Methylobacterium sp. 2A]PVZ07228.1 PAS domain S-box-containing protein [Methylobacterium organophilum]
MRAAIPSHDVFEATPNPYLLLAADSPTFTIIGVNEAYLRATMTEREAITGRSLFEVFPDDPATPKAFGERNLRASLDRAIQTGLPDRMAVQHYNIRGPDGVFVERHWRPLSVPVTGPGGEVLSLIHYVEDVTSDVVGTRDTQTALTASDARYRAIVESSTDYAMVAMDLSGTITTWNTGAEHVLGWRAEEMVGRPSETFFTEEDRTAGIPAQEMRAALEQGRGIDERWHLRKDGSRFWANGELMPLKDEAGAVIGFLKILRDRTSQREVERALAEQTDILRSVTDHVSEAVFRLDPDGTILLANPPAGRLFGWPADELVGRNLHETLHHHREDGTAFPAEECIFVRALREGTSIVAEETVFFRQDGTPVPVTCTNAPLLRDGEVVGAVVTVTDLTARKRAAEQQDILNHELSHRLKNTLAIVQSIATQTLRGVTERHLVEAFERRVLALSRAHDVLVQKSWAAARMRSVMESVLAMQADLDRFALDGPDLDISPQAALSLSLLLHEMATNALKYGSLSAGAGKVRISWRTETDPSPTLVLDWAETDGPPVVPPSTRGGFGSKLIRMGLLGTRVAALDYAPVGLRAEFRAPLAEVLVH